MATGGGGGGQQPLIMADYTIDKSFKQAPATKCFSNHCGGGGVIPGPGSPMMSKKHPPEPPRRQCSAPASSGGGGVLVDQFGVHFDALSLAQQQQAAANLAAAAAVAANQQHFTAAQQYFNPHLPHNYQHYSNQPVYANFIGGGGGSHQTTTVEVHAEKINDSKVSIAWRPF